jgi:hypothetical protein
LLSVGASLGRELLPTKGGKQTVDPLDSETVYWSEAAVPPQFVDKIILVTFWTP